MARNAFFPGRDIPRSRPQPLCQLVPALPSRPGTALRSCPLAPARAGDMGGHPSPSGAPRVLRAITGAPRTSAVPVLRERCRCVPHPRSRCVAAADGPLVVLAFKMVSIEVFSVTGLECGADLPGGGGFSRSGDQPDAPHPCAGFGGFGSSQGYTQPFISFISLFISFISLSLWEGIFPPSFTTTKTSGCICKLPSLESEHYGGKQNCEEGVNAAPPPPAVRRPLQKKNALPLTNSGMPPSLESRHCLPLARRCVVAPTREE